MVKPRKKQKNDAINTKRVEDIRFHFGMDVEEMIKSKYRGPYNTVK